MAVDGIVTDRSTLGARPEMGDDLVAEEVEIYPLIGTAAFGTAEHSGVKGACGVKVVDREGYVKWSKCHG
jgi:hypothetical protein